MWQQSYNLTCYTSHPYDPTPEQTEDVDGQNWIQIKKLRFYRFNDFRPEFDRTQRMLTPIIAHLYLK
jgi:hypothetical protein